MLKIKHSSLGYMLPQKYTRYLYIQEKGPLSVKYCFKYIYTLEFPNWTYIDILLHLQTIIEYSTIRKAYLRQSNYQLVGSMQM